MKTASGWPASNCHCCSSSRLSLASTSVTTWAGEEGLGGGDGHQTVPLPLHQSHAEGGRGGGGCASQHRDQLWPGERRLADRTGPGSVVAQGEIVQHAGPAVNVAAVAHLTGCGWTETYWTLSSAPHHHELHLLPGGGVVRVLDRPRPRPHHHLPPGRLVLRPLRSARHIMLAAARCGEMTSPTAASHPTPAPASIAEVEQMVVVLFSAARVED